MSRPGPDATVGFAVLVLCAVLFRETYSFRVPPFATMSTGTWPRFVLVVLALLSFALLAKSLWQLSSSRLSRAEAPPPFEWASQRNALICFGLFTVFLIALPWLGMLIAGFVFVFAMQELIGPRDLRSRLLHLAIAAVSVGSMWAVFTFALRVILPEGVILRF